MIKLNDIICENKTNIDEREVKLNEEYHQLIKNDKQLNIASEYIYSELIDDLILSCAFEAHYAAKKLHTEKEVNELICKFLINHFLHQNLISYRKMTVLDQAVTIKK